MSEIANNTENFKFRINKWSALSLFGFLSLLSSVKMLVVRNPKGNFYFSKPKEHPFLILSFLLLFIFNQVQLTDFENAAFVAFIVLLTRAILSFHLNLLIPLSKVRIKTKGKLRKWRVVSLSRLQVLIPPVKLYLGQVPSTSAVNFATHAQSSLGCTRDQTSVSQD